ncbi:PAS domain-containing protein [Pelagibacterium sp.]|uniref:PAS domain-containing protein n=1 Tax=Pelagibacterium sp. TaxID=1967288 RepID=UPI003C7E7A58
MPDSPGTIDELRRQLAEAENRASTAEAELREAGIRHHVLMESWSRAVWETDAAGAVIKDSPSWRAYTGQTQEEWGYGWLDAIHPDDREHAERQWREAIAARSLSTPNFGFVRLMGAGAGPMSLPRRCMARMAISKDGLPSISTSTIAGAPRTRCATAKCVIANFSPRWMRPMPSSKC